MIFPDAGTIGGVTLRKVFRHLMPLLCLLYLVNILDRVNVGYAALAMNPDLGISRTQYGLAAGVFFLGYIAAEVPSNLLLLRFGARRWIARIMVSWGIVSMANALTWNAPSLYVIRFLLGLTEAGFFPATIFYLALWIPAQHRSKALAVLGVATQIAPLLGAPLSGWILSQGTAGGIAAWRWLFLLEGVPAVLLGAYVLFRLPETPKGARWLTPAEQNWLTDHLQGDIARAERVSGTRFVDGLRSLPMWTVAVIKFANGLVNFGLGLWLPLIARQTAGLSDRAIALLVAGAALAGTIVMIVAGILSDRSGRRRLHLSAAFAVLGAAMMAAALVSDPVANLAALCLASTVVPVTFALSWALAPAILAGRAAAGGFAILNMAAIFAGFVGSSLTGLLRDWTGSFSSGYWFMAGCCGLSAVLCLTLNGDAMGEEVSVRVASA